MPSLRSRSIDIRGTHGRPVMPHHPGQPEPHPVGGEPVIHPTAPIPTPQPIHVRRGPTMITSVPAIAQSADGNLRQFYYGDRSFPTRRIPSL